MYPGCFFSRPSPSEFLCSSYRPHLSVRALPTWVSALPRHHHRASHAGSHLPLVPSGGLSLTTVFSARWLTGFFHPAAESRTSPSRGLSSSRSPPPSSGGDAPLPLDRSCSPTRAGCHRDQSSTSRPCSTRGRQSTGSVVSLPGDCSPLRVSMPLQVLLQPLLPKDQTSMVLPQHLFDRIKIPSLGCPDHLRRFHSERPAALSP